MLSRNHAANCMLFQRRSTSLQEEPIQKKQLKILIVRLSSIGDIILTTPLIRQVRQRFPSAQIDFLIKEEFIELISTNSHISNIIRYRKKNGLSELREIKNRIQQTRYDLFIDIHKNFRSYYLRFFSHASKKKTYRKFIFKRSLLVWFGLNMYKEILPVYERYFIALQSFEIKYDNKGTELRVPEDKIKKIQSLLTEKNCVRSPLVLICPGASSENKKWLPEKFSRMADELCKKKNTSIILHGGKSDIQTCNKIQNMMRHSAVNLAGSLSLLESAALAHSSDLVITNDSGMMHIAQSQKKQVIAIFGPTTKELGYFPMPEKSIVIENNIPCRPCTHNGLNKCPKKHFKCMKEILAQDVIAAAENFI